MQSLARMVAVMLLAALAAAQPATQVLALYAPTLSSPGCHGHRAQHSSSPATPVPVKYQCCVNGHHAAIPSSAFSGHRGLALISGVNGGFGMAIRPSSDLPPIPTLASSSSPPTTPLRI